MKRVRTLFAAWSVLFNQVVHLGNAPYPLSFSETCFIRRNRWQYRLCLLAIDGIFSLFGELDHCEKAWYIGYSHRSRYADLNKGYVL